MDTLNFNSENSTLYIVGKWMNLSIFSPEPITQEQFLFPSRFKILLMLNPHFSGTVLEEIEQSIDIEYHREFHERCFCST